MIRHAHSQSGGFSSESIPLCQVNQPKSETPENVISINVPVISSSVNEKIQTPRRKRTSESAETKLNSNYERLSDSKDYNEHNMKNHKKYLNSLENISDSIHNLLNCVPIYNFCQSKKGSENPGKKREEEQPLFFVGEKDLYYKSDEANHQTVIHHCRGASMSPEETEMYGKLLPQESKPKRYSRSSLKKQKISLYEEGESDSYKKVPTQETAKPETPKPKPKTLTPAEIKRKTFLRKVSLQDTYLNYNQDYWLDFEKTGRIHRSIDLGYFGNDDENENKKVTGPKTKLQEVSEKSNEDEKTINESKAIIIRQSDLPSRYHKTGKKLNRRDSEPVMVRNKKCSCNNCGNRVRESERETKTVADIIADLNKSINIESRKSWFLPSNENIPLFYERNGQIETDFNMLNDLLDEDCLLIDRIESSSPVEHQFVYNGHEDESSNDRLSCDSNVDDLFQRFDISDFCEIKLNSNNDDDDKVDSNDVVKRSSVFNFQGGQAFFGENRISTSEESDVFVNETDLGRIPHEKRRSGYSVPIVSVSTASKSPSPELS